MCIGPSNAIFFQTHRSITPRSQRENALLSENFPSQRIEYFSSDYSRLTFLTSNFFSSQLPDFDYNDSLQSYNSNKLRLSPLIFSSRM